jgi:hypothetical protein
MADDGNSDREISLDPEAILKIKDKGHLRRVSELVINRWHGENGAGTRAYSARLMDAWKALHKYNYSHEDPKYPAALAKLMNDDDNDDDDDEGRYSMSDNKLSTPAFAPVVQPDYRWTESVNPKGIGTTALPATDGGIAHMTIPDGHIAQTPEGRLIRIHELLHARFTPEVDAVARGRDGHEEATGLSPMALQIGEDVRLHKIAAGLGVYGDDAFVSDETYVNISKNDKLSPIAKQMKAAQTFMAGYGLPTESGWSTKDLSAFQEVTGASLSRRTRRVLKAWANVAEELLAKGEGVDQFVGLAKKSQKAMDMILVTPPASKPKKGEEGKSAKGGGGSSGEGEDHPETEKELQEKSKKAVEKHQQALSGGRGELEARKEAVQAQNEAARAQKDLKPYKNNAPFKSWEPAFLSREDLEKLEQQAAMAYAAKWKPSLDPHQSPYTPGGERLSVAAPEDYSLDPLDTGWHVMQTRLGPLQRNFRAVVRRKGVSSPEGPYPKFFNRWFSDKQLFERKGRRLGGTLLIDISGSMSWSHAQTLALIESTPAMTIAVYSSDGADQSLRTGTAATKMHRAFMDAHGRPMTNREITAYEREHGMGFGRMTIIAQHGKLVPAEYQLHSSRIDDLHAGHGGGNEVDGPALSWLAKQAFPRVWFSDGQVTGTGEVASRQLFTDSRRLQRLGNIVRTTNADAVKMIFSGRPGWHTMNDVWIPGGRESNPG